MTIFLQRESGSEALVAALPTALLVESLERDTGADVLVSPSSLPLGCLEDHLEEGAVMVQRKKGLDFPSSVGGRLMESLARMCQYRVGHWQRMLMTIGMFTHKNYHTRVNGRFVDEKMLGSDWRKLRTARMSWWAGGGTVENTLNIEDEAEYYLRLEKMLKEHKPGEGYTVFPRVEPLPPIGEFDPERPLVSLTPAPPAMVFYASLPGIGSKRARATWETYGDDVGLAVISLTHPDPKAHRPEGIGQGTVKSLRQFFCLPPGTILMPQVLDRIKFERGIPDDY